MGEIPPRTVTIGESVTVDATPHFSDPDGDSLTYAATSSSTGVAGVSVSGADVTVTGVSAGTAAITVTASDPDGLSASQSFEVTVPNRAPAAMGEIPPHTMIPGETATVDVTPYFSDPDGDSLRYAASSSDIGVIGVSVSGSRVTVEALAPGTATVKVTARDPEGLAASQSASVTGTTSILTAIRDIDAFLDGCPENDPAYPRIQRDFEIRLEGEVIADPIVCSEPATAMSSDEVTYQLTAYQTFRFAYYMNDGTEGRLPWTEKGLYEWMASRISGINIKSGPPERYYCCDLINGNLYVATSVGSPGPSGEFIPFEYLIDWDGLFRRLSFYAHEVRHVDSDDPGHVTGCAEFPRPTDPPGCDATYDLGNLGAYGVSYWLESGWATGYLNVGIGCSPRAEEYVINVADAAEHLRRYRFVTDFPPPVLPTPSYGGPCIPPDSPWK